MDCLRHFSNDYQEARARFLTACDQAGAAVYRTQNPRSGPNGGDLYTDVGVIGPQDANEVLVLQSGTHGIEGFAGAAIQTALLHDPILSNLTSRIRLVLIHAINPWGFAHLRRTNEDNVDLNRNFVDHTRKYPDNQPYRKLDHILAPKKLSSLSRTAGVARLLSYGAVHGMAALRVAISAGQYSHPKGLFFGGNNDVWSNKVLKQILRERVPGSGRLGFIDFHTGLGQAGYGEIILNDSPDSPQWGRAMAWWGDRVKSTKAGNSVSADPVGTMKTAIGETLKATEVTAVSLEFGTLPPKAVLVALIAENWLYHRGDHKSPRAERIKAELRRAFYTETDDWKTAVWEQGRQVILQATDGLVQ